MRLMIDCFKLIKGKGKSIGIYNVALGIVRNLGRINKSNNNSPVEIMVLGNKFNKVDFDVKGIRFVEVEKLNPLNKFHLVFWELIGVTRMCKKLNADKVFYPRGFSSLVHDVYDVVLIHDCIPFYYNEFFSKYINKIENAYILWRLKESARNSKKIITISQASKNDIIKYCGVDETKIIVINNGFESFTRMGEENEKIDTEYICAMTSNLPHKNARGVICSYIEYCKISAHPIDLVIIGLEDISCYDIPSNIREKIRCYKFIKSDEEMHKLIGGSQVFMFLSLKEGFGLPPIEAMQLEVPVICSNVSSLTEVVGDAALMVDYNDYRSIAYNLNRVLTNKKIKEKMRKKGNINIKRFSWDYCSAKYWDELVNEEGESIYESDRD